jgi:hypothetical protein
MIGALLALGLIAQTEAVTLAWDASPAAASYRVYFGNDRPGLYTAWTEVGNALEHTVTLPDGIWYLAVSAGRDNLWSGFSNEVTVTIGGSAPPPPPPPDPAVPGAPSGFRIVRREPVVTSPEGTRLPPSPRVVDSSGNVWTLSGIQVIRNGQAIDGWATIIAWCAGKVRVLGTDSVWYEWADRWMAIGSLDPCR